MNEQYFILGLFILIAIFFILIAIHINFKKLERNVLRRSGYYSRKSLAAFVVLFLFAGSFTLSPILDTGFEASMTATVGTLLFLLLGLTVADKKFTNKKDKDDTSN